MTTDDPAVSVCFSVTVDSAPLGDFLSCEGLGLEIVMEQREEGGNNGMVWQLPSRVKFSTVKLTRPVCGDSYKLAEWVSAVIGGYTPTTAKIAAKNGNGDTVAEWSLQGVLPVRWTGPSLNLESPKVATETVELIHHGIRGSAGGRS
ncbi:phage tail protein [Gordonia sp. NPDC003424]